MKKIMAWMVFLCLGSVQMANASSYVLAVQPCWPPEKALAMFTPLTNYLSLVLKKPCELAVYDSSAQFHQDVGNADMVIQDAYSAYRHQGLAAFAPVAIIVNKNNKTTDRGAIIVRKDSPYHKVTDLKGKRFLFGSLHSTQKFFCTWILLKKNGIDPWKDLIEIAPGGD